MVLPNIHFGEVTEEPLDWRQPEFEDLSSDDDEEVATSWDIEEMLGFDPLEEEEPVAKAGSGIMIGYFLPTEQAEALQVEGGESADEIHLTLAYFGKVDQHTEGEIETLKKQVERFSRRYAPLQGKIDGIAKFPPTDSSDSKEVLVRLVNVPRLERFREELLEELEDQQWEAYATHGYVPHITLAYKEPGSLKELPEATPIEFAIDNLVVAIGGEHFVYPLNGETVIKFNPCHNPSVGKLDLGINQASDLEVDFFSSLDVNKSFHASISKVDDDKHLVFGWVTIAEEDGKPLTDLQGDIISEEEMEKMAYNFTKECRVAGEMHKRKGIGTLVESIAFTKEKQKAMGIDLGKSGWWCGFHIDDDDVWKKVKTGEYKAFSIHGKGLREKIDG